MTFWNRQIDHMVNQFLRWKLPRGFNPDGGISFEPLGSKGTAYEFRREPVGTNLFTATQAREMVEEMLVDLPDNVSPRDMEIHDHGLELASCPACAAKNVFLTHSVQNMDARKHVECRICCAQGPQRTSNADAAEAWNNMPRNSGLELNMLEGSDLMVGIPPGCEFSMVQVGAIRKLRIYMP